MPGEDYQKYIELCNSRQLDSDGRYVTTKLAGEQAFSPPAGSVHVTFAENAYITVQYYLDASLKTLANTQQCYLRLGNYIYASEPECHYPSSNCIALTDSVSILMMQREAKSRTFLECRRKFSVSATDTRRL